MGTGVTEGYAALSEKEKQTLRLIVRGHDAKSIARSLDLSVHTINERLRDARRKLAVSSSREAARVVLEIESDVTAAATPNSVGDMQIGDAAAGDVPDEGAASIGDAQRPRRRWITFGATLMTVFLGILALAALPQMVATSSQGTTPAAEAPVNDAVAQAARQWLELGDQAQWEAAYRGTGGSFAKLNTLEAWIAVSQKVRAPLGAVKSRVLIERQFTPAPPPGYETVRFGTSFASGANIVETVSLAREDGQWRVVGVTFG